MYNFTRSPLTASLYYLNAWNRLLQTQICKFGRTKFDTCTVLLHDEVLISLFILIHAFCFLLNAVREKYSYIPHATLHFICVWTFWTISSWLEQIRNSLICWKIQQKIHETHKIWHRSEQKITSLSTSMRDSNTSRGMCENFGNSGAEAGKFWGLFLENLEGRGQGHTENPSVGVAWIFSETTQCTSKKILRFCATAVVCIFVLKVYERYFIFNLQVPLEILLLILHTIFLLLLLL